MYFAGTTGGRDALHRAEAAYVEVQVFGTRKNPDTRKALRFFSERRVRVHFVDLQERPASRGELLRFVQRFGVSALVDHGSARYRALGLDAARYSDDRWIQLLCDEPLVLRQPLARLKHSLSIGLAESEWLSWVEVAVRR